MKKMDCSRQWQVQKIKIPGAPLPALQDFYTSRDRKREKKTTTDSPSPWIQLLPAFPLWQEIQSSAKTATHSFLCFLYAILVSSVYCLLFNMFCPWELPMTRSKFLACVSWFWFWFLMCLKWRQLFFWILLYNSLLSVVLHEIWIQRISCTMYDWDVFGWLLSFDVLYLLCVCLLDEAALRSMINFSMNSFIQIHVECLFHRPEFSIVVDGDIRPELPVGGVLHHAVNGLQQLHHGQVLWRGVTHMGHVNTP